MTNLLSVSTGSLSISTNTNNTSIVASSNESSPTDNDDYYFEGAEKLLEVWFNNDSMVDAKSLRVIPEAEWIALLDLAQCQILSRRKNEKLDAYVLSESSMFVSDTRFILKTCGATRLLNTIERLLELAREYCNLDSVTNVYYSRKNFVRPELQSTVHRCFDREVELLDNYFEDGAAYCMGSLKQDRWYLYTVNNIPLAHVDHTLEILMCDLPDEITRVYTKEVCVDGDDCTKKAGIDKLVPIGTIIDHKLFDPCGYSMNGLLPNSDHYVTIHVTPEPDFSYASFETNQNSIDFYKQTIKVLDCFKPNKFILTIFANELSSRGKDSQQQLWDRDLVGYRRTNLQFLRLAHDTLVYAQYRRCGTVKMANIHHN